MPLSGEQIEIVSGAQRVVVQRFGRAARAEGVARGQAQVSKKGSKKLKEFSAALQDLMRDLAIQVAKDGEGLTKFVTFEVQGAKSAAAARKIGLSARAVGKDEPIIDVRSYTSTDGGMASLGEIAGLNSSATEDSPKN